MRIFVLIALALLLPAKALAVDLDNAHTVQLLFENDFFFDTDRWNTSQQKLVYYMPPLEDAQPAKTTAWTHFPAQKRDGFYRSLAFAVGQEIFTPEELQTRRLINDDRPYAGYLYLGVTVNNASLRQLDSLELQLGVVGPSSLAEDTQDFIHGNDAKGWHNQLADEAAFLLTWNRFLRAYTRSMGGDFGFEALPRFGVSAGTVMAFATAGFELRLGQRLPSSFATALVRPGYSVSGPFDRDDPRLKRQFGWYLFAAADARAVGHNIFLDGGVFRDGHSVSKNAFVSELTAGAVLFWKGAQATFAPAWRSKEFDNQDEAQLFATANLAVTF